MQNIYKKKIASLYSSINFKKKYGNRIFTYHSINKKKNSTTSGIYQLDKELFCSHINYLIEKKVDFKFIDNFDNTKSNYLLTFDDGFKNFKSDIVEFLSVNEIPCMIFLSPDLIKSNNHNYLNQEDVKELSKNKFIKIGSHSYNHQKLIDFDEKNLNFQLETSKKWLEDLTSQEVNSISYPYGAFNKIILDKVKEHKYKYGFTTRFNFHYNFQDNFRIPRIDIWDSDDIQTFQKKIEGKWNWMRFFSKY